MAKPLKPLRTGEIACLAGVSSDTVRHYEKLGILPRSPRAASGYRAFPPDALHRVEIVRRAQQLGFSLAELSDIFRTRDLGGAPCRRVLRLAEHKLGNLTKQIEQLRRTERCLRRLVAAWRSQLSRTPRGKNAHLLHSLLRQPALRRKGFNLKGRYAI